MLFRVYKSSPDDVSIQVRGMRGTVPTFATAYLSSKQIRDVRDYLTALLAEHFDGEG
jgi:hypothetical protein